VPPSVPRWWVACFSLNDPEAARLFAALLQLGPGTLGELSLERQAIILSEVGVAFRNAFLTIALFAGVGAVLAWTIPARRLG
jgi:hypothetical protein